MCRTTNDMDDQDNIPIDEPLENYLNDCTDRYIYAICQRGSLSQLKQVLLEVRKLNINTNLEDVYTTIGHTICQTYDLTQLKQTIPELQQLNINIKNHIYSSMHNAEIFEYIYLASNLSYEDKTKLLHNAIKNNHTDCINYLFTQEPQLTNIKIDMLDRAIMRRTVSDIIGYHMILNKGIQFEVDTIMHWYGSKETEIKINIDQSNLINSMYKVCTILHDYIKKTDDGRSSIKPATSHAMVAKSFIIRLIRNISAFNAGMTSQNIKTFFLLTSTLNETIRENVEYITGLSESDQHSACEKLLSEKKMWIYIVYNELMIIQFQLCKYEKCKEYVTKIITSVCEIDNQYKADALHNCSRILMACPDLTDENIKLAIKCIDKAISYKDMPKLQMQQFINHKALIGLTQININT